MNFAEAPAWKARLLSSRNIPPDFQSELSVLLDKYGIDQRALPATLQRRHGRSKLADLFAVIEIAMQAEGLIPSLKYLYYFMDYTKVYIDDNGVLRLYRFDKTKIGRVPHCTAANMLAEQIVPRTYRRSAAERLRRKFTKHETYYRSLARNYISIVECALKWSRVPWEMFPASQEVSLVLEIANTIADFPEMSLYISYVTLPALSEFCEDLRARIQRHDKERVALVKRRQELEIIQRWHVLADFEGLPVSEGTGKKQLQEAVDGINALRRALQPIDFQ